MTSTIQSEVQKLDADAVVTLYQIDTAPIGGTDVFSFTKRTAMGGNLVFGGVTFNAIDIAATGFLFDGKGAFPQPKLQVSNVGNLAAIMTVTNNDLQGCTLTRIRTFAKFLDDGAEPDSTAMFPPDVYTIDQKTKHTKQVIEFSLASPLDQAGRKLPRRQCLRDYCSHTYRIYDPDTDTFDTTKASCPYAGTNYFDENGDTTVKANDSCGRRITDCKLRFGTDPLPTRAFPGMPRSTK